MNMRNEGFLETLFKVIRHSLAIGLFFVSLTVLIGIMKNTSDTPYFVSMFALFLLSLSAFAYAKRNFYGQRN